MRFLANRVLNPRAHATLFAVAILVAVDVSPCAAQGQRQSEGLYLRAGVGPSYAGTSVSTGSQSHPDYVLRGAGLSADLMIGGTPWLGIAVGGAASFSAFALGHPGTSSMWMLGPFIDGYPSDRNGLHLGGLLGVASVHTDRDDDVDELDGIGLGVAAWIGQDFFVGGEWSVGGMLRAKGALARELTEGDDSVELSSASYEIALMLTALLF